MFSSSSTQQLSTFVLSARRAFSSALVCSKEYAHVTVRKQKEQRPLEVGMPRRFMPKVKPEFPAYPYGDAVLFKQSNKGLYGGKIIQFGNQISEFRNKSRRSWLPNINRHKLWSEALNRDINIKTTSRVLRTISKEGGIDRYLTKDKAARIKELGPTGWKLRYRVMTKLDAQEKTRPKIIEKVETNSGDSLPVFSKHTTKSGSEIKIRYGKRKLLQELFGVLQKQDVNAGKSYRKFVHEYGSKPTEHILTTLEEHNFDFSKVSV